jgi:hypothetical protein
MADIEKLPLEAPVYQNGGKNGSRNGGLHENGGQNGKGAYYADAQELHAQAEDGRWRATLCPDHRLGLLCA